LAWGGSLAILSIPTVKIYKILKSKMAAAANPRWRRAPSWKIEKLPYLDRNLTNFEKIWRGEYFGEYFLVSTKLDTFCYPTVQTAPCYVPLF